jgi:PAS domain S-box-containing protein
MSLAESPNVSHLALPEIGDRFRLFADAVQDYAIFMLDVEGRVISWNAGAQRMKGYLPEEIIGRHFSCLYPDQDLRSRKPQRHLEVAARDGRLEDEGWRVRKDGSRFWANVVITAIRDPVGNLIGFGKVTRDFTDRMRAQEALRRANSELAREVAERKLAENRLANSERSLRLLSQHLLRAQDEERRRIGRDLHDSLGQYLAVLKINLDSLVPALGSKNGEAARLVAQCVRLAQDSIREVRTISHLLYPPLLEEMGLRSAIPWYLDGFTKRSHIQTTFQVDPNFGRLPPDVELALFRVLQESLTNVHRHSGSTAATVRLSMLDGMASIEIQDQGKGISSELLEEVDQDWLGSLGVGLRGMNERMRQLGGKLEVKSNQSGTTIAAMVPAVQPPPSALSSAR